MKAAEILELTDLVCVEGSFADLADPASADPVLSLDPEAGKLLVDEDEDLMAVAFRSGGTWYAANYLFHSPKTEVIDLFEGTEGDIYQEDREVWTGAVREYYSEVIREEVRPSIEDIPPDRPGKIADLVTEVWGRQEGTICIDCCCGSGVGAAALRSVVGMRTLAYDHDPALIARGFEEGRLVPAETACIDGTVATAYFRRVPYGTAFMMGTIRSFDSGIWERLTLELLALSGETLITVATEEEARMVATWCRSAGRKPDVWESDRDPLYDRWVCLS
ncbi:hypothetical protein [uncultured Methanofollis sp.]|uniref:hypothetical protein n=1 Tax=uncultured Methanofollis sp. TaxID=262500 RepID=UPI0026247DC7|nr:hypothetical protein [uncultured Methanofollis sp.]